MSTGDPGRQQDPYRTETPRTGWYGYIAFAGIMLCVLGALPRSDGPGGPFEEDYYAVGDSGLMRQVDYSGVGLGASHLRVLSLPAPESH